MAQPGFAAQPATRDDHDVHQRHHGEEREDRCKDSEANRFGAGYEVLLYSADGRDVALSTGMRIPVPAAAAT